MLKDNKSLVSLNQLSNKSTKEIGIDWEDLFIFIKMLVYRRHEDLNIYLCKCYLKVMSEIDLKKYKKLSKKSLDKVISYLEKKNGPIKNSISLNNMDEL